MSNAFWFGAAGLTLLALAFLAIPLWRERVRSGRLALSGPLAALAIVPVAFVLYLRVTTFDPDAARSVPDASSAEMALLNELAARLNENPDNVGGWILLGQSYREFGDYTRARLAFEQAWNRTESPDASLKLSYAETMLITEPATARGLAGDLIEEVIAAAPQNQAALWLGGIVATERNQLGVAVERFSALLALGPPPEIAEIIRRQLQLLAGAGETAPAAAAAAAGPVIEVEVSVAEDVSLEGFGPNARMFLLARSSDMPAPIAVKPIELSALPGSFTLSDADAMLPGRTLSQYESVSLVARISASGTAAEQPGDVYAEATIDPASGETVRLIIDRVVPEG